MSSPPPAVIFDLDGVLLDTEGLYTQATQAVVGRFGRTYDWSLKRRTMGRDARVSARLILESLEVPLTPEEFLAERQPILEGLLISSPVMPGAEAFVQRLVGHGARLAIATSSERRLFDMKTGPHAWFRSFEAIVCGDDSRATAKKPAPDLFLLAARDLGVDPASAVVLEDSPAGVQGALAAGMRVVVLADRAMNAADYPPLVRIVRSYAEIENADWSA